MGVDVTIKRKGLFKKAMNINEFINMLDENDNILLVGTDGVSKEVEDGWEYNEEPLIVYDYNMIGRGFEITFHNKELELRLPFLCAKRDVEIFYKYIEKICNKMGVTEFSQDEEQYNLNELNNTLNYIIDVNKYYLNETFNDEEKGDSLLVFGALYPISIENSFSKSLKNLSADEQQLMYDNYLNEKQQTDIYYARNMLIRLDNNVLAGIYAIGQGIETVLPAKDSSFFEKPEKQFVAVGFGDANDMDKYESFEVSFEDFKKVIDFQNCTKFDEATVQVNLDEDDIKRLAEYRCEIE